MKIIKIEYFAVLRELAGRDKEELQTNAGTPSGVYAELGQRYALPAQNNMKVAINDEFADWDTILHDGDEVVFIPPVAGG